MKLSLTPLAFALLAFAVPQTQASHASSDIRRCRVYPDPHYENFHGQYFDYHGGCDLVLINVPGFPGANPGFPGGALDLQIRTRPMGGYSGIISAVLQIGGQKFEVGMGHALLNGIPFTAGGMINGYTITETPTASAVDYDVLLPGSQFVRITEWFGGGGSLMVHVNADGQHFGGATGLCGMWTTPGLLDRNGQSSNPDALGDSWQVQFPDAFPLFSTPFESPQHIFGQTCHPPDAPNSDKPPIPEDEAERLCGGVRNNNDRENCIFDLVTTRDPEFANAPWYPADGGGGGDPHFHTFHGDYYGYHGVCDLVMVHSLAFGSGLGLDLHIRTEEREGYSSISNAALRIGSDVFEVVNDGKYFLNGVLDPELPVKLGGVYRITRKGATETDVFLPDVSHGFTKPELMESTLFDVNLGGGENIQIQVWKDYIWVNVRGGGSNFKDGVGLMGTWGKPGKIARDGSTDMEDLNAFGEEWQVRGTEPKLFQTVRAPQHPERCLPAPVASVGRRLGEERHAEEACAQVAGKKKEFCVFDVMVTGDVEIAKVYLD